MDGYDCENLKKLHICDVAASCNVYRDELYKAATVQL